MTIKTYTWPLVPQRSPSPLWHRHDWGEKFARSVKAVLGIISYNVKPPLAKGWNPISAIPRESWAHLRLPLAFPGPKKFKALAMPPYDGIGLDNVENGPTPGNLCFENMTQKYRSNDVIRGHFTIWWRSANYCLSARFSSASWCCPCRAENKVFITSSKYFNIPVRLYQPTENVKKTGRSYF
jgi:hypothetical protein